MFSIRPVATQSCRLDLVPAPAEFLIGNSVLENTDDISTLQNPTDERKQIDDKKRRGDHEITDVLADIETNEHCQKKEKGQNGNDRGPLEMCRRDAVNADEFT